MAVSVLAGALIFVLQCYFLRQRPVRKRADEPASFRRLDELVSERRLVNLSYLYAIPFTLLFVFTAIESKEFIDGAKNLLGTGLGHALEHREWLAELVNGIWKSVPDYLNPLLVLGAALFLLLPYVRAPLLIFRNFLVKIMGIDARANRLARQAAKDILEGQPRDSAAAPKRHRNADVGHLLTKTYSAQAAPLPEKMTLSLDETRAAYQLLYFVRTEVPSVGLDQALRDCLRRLGVQPSWQESPLPSINYAHLASAATIYIVLCTLFFLIDPIPGRWINSSSLSSAHLIEWYDPNAAGYRDLMVSIFQRLLAIVFPLAAGMYIYCFRGQTESNHESIFQRYSVVFTVQFAQALVANLVFTSYAIASRSVNKSFSGLVISFASVKIWEDIFVSSLVPGAALAAWIICARYKSKALKVCALCITVGLALFFRQLLYEVLSVLLCDEKGCQMRGFYWHQFLLGSYIAGAYCVSASAAKVLLPAPEMRHPG